MSIKDDLGNRMKDYYETISKTRLTRRTPVAIRLDGKTFHTFTRGFKKPFDRILMKAMQDTMKYLCENIQGCVFGYTQSDEITLILTDYKKLTTDAWYDYEVQKLCSVSASMATLAFNKFFKEQVELYEAEHSVKMSWYPLEDTYYQTLCNATVKGALFDARCFNIPKEEVTNLIYWRQLDATRNSIQMLGQAYFSHKELQGKSCSYIQERLATRKGINWNDFPADCKHGAACFRNTYEVVDSTDPDLSLASIFDTSVPEKSWVIDLDMPILKGTESRRYVDKWVFLP